MSDIGDYKDIPIIGMLVKAGNGVNTEGSPVTLESDKAAVDAPSPKSDVVKEVKTRVGDVVLRGSLVLLLEEQGAAAAPAPTPQAAPVPIPVAAAPAPIPAVQTPTPASATAGGDTIKVKMSDIGNYANVSVIEISVGVGGKMEARQPLIALGSDEAMVDMPSPAASTARDIRMKVGDIVSQDTLIVVLEGTDAAVTPAPAQAPASTPTAAPAVAASNPAPAAVPAAVPATAPAMCTTDAVGTVGRTTHASPSVCKYTHELGVSVNLVDGIGPKNRIAQGNIQYYIEGAMSDQATVPGGAATGASTDDGELNLPPWPKVGLTKLGPVDPELLSCIKKISGTDLRHN